MPYAGTATTTEMSHFKVAAVTFTRATFPTDISRVCFAATGAARRTANGISGTRAAVVVPEGTAVAGASTEERNSQAPASPALAMALDEKALPAAGGVSLDTLGRSGIMQAATTIAKRHSGSRSSSMALAATILTGDSVTAAPPNHNHLVSSYCCTRYSAVKQSFTRTLRTRRAVQGKAKNCSFSSSNSTSGSSYGSRTSDSSVRKSTGGRRFSPVVLHHLRSSRNGLMKGRSSSCCASYYSSSRSVTARNGISNSRDVSRSCCSGNTKLEAYQPDDSRGARVGKWGREHLREVFLCYAGSIFTSTSSSSSTTPACCCADSGGKAALPLQEQQNQQRVLSFSSVPLLSSRGSLLFRSCFPSFSRRFSSFPHAESGSEGASDDDLTVTEGHVEISQFHDGSRGRFRPHPFNRRFSRVKRPLFPIEPRNLRLMYKRKSKRRRGRGDKSNAKGIRLKHVHLQAGRYRGPRSRTFEGGKTPLYRRIPKWPEAWLARQRKTMEPLNLSKLRAFIESGRLDARFPITQRHLNDSRCVKVRNGVRLFNVNDYPFPYKIQIEVSGADQSAIDAIRRVGGEVHIVYRNRLNLRAHVKPYKFEVLPRTARPNLEMLHYLEKMRARGCVVKYIKPQWLIDEEKSLKRELLEFKAEALIAAGEGVDSRDPRLRPSVEDVQEKLLRQFRLRETLAAKLEREQEQQQEQGHQPTGAASHDL